MKPAPKKLALLMSAMGVGLLLPDHALAHSDLHARSVTASALGLDAGAVPPCHGFGGVTPAQCQLANRDVPLHAAITAASVQALWSTLPDKAPHLIEARWTQWSVGARSRPSPPRQETPGVPPPASRPHEARALATPVLHTAAPPTLGKPNDVAARPDAKGIQYTSAGSDHDREADAIAMVLMADPPSQARIPAPVVVMELTPATAPAAAVAPVATAAPVAAVAKLPPAAAVTAAASLASVKAAQAEGLAVSFMPVPGSNLQVERASTSSDLDRQWRTDETLALATQASLTAAPPSVGRRDPAAAHPDPKPTEQTNESRDLDRKADALAMILMADPRPQARGTAPASAPAIAAATAAAPVVAIAPVVAAAPADTVAQGPASAAVAAVAKMPSAAAVLASAALASMESAETAALATRSASEPGSTPEAGRAGASSDLVTPQRHEHAGQTLVPAPQATLAAALPPIRRPNDAVARRDPKAAEQSSENKDRDREANAIAMVLMADPPSQVPVRALAAKVPSVASVAAAKPSTSIEAVRSTVPDVEAAISLAPIPPRVSSTATIKAEARAMQASVPLSLPSQRRDRPTPTQATDKVVAGDAAAGPRFVAPLRDTALPAAPSIAQSAPIDQMPGAVGKLASSPPESPTSAWQAHTAQVATSKRSPAAFSPSALPVPNPTDAASAAPIDAASRADKSRKQLSARQEIVVATHSDKVLMSLAALQSDEGPEAGRFGAQTKETVVVRHTDKVLLNLASLRADKASKRERCTTPPAADPRHEPRLSASTDTVECATSKAASTAPAIAGHNFIGGNAVALSGDKLDEVRGGFVTDAGLQVSFGIERAIYLNGNLVTTTSLNVTELGTISTGQVQLGTPSTGGVTLIQSGTGNTFLPGTISPSAVGTVIQNTLDNQKIQTITRVDAAVTAAGAVRALNLHSSMRGAITNSLRR